MAHAEKCPICLGKGKIAYTGKEAVIPWIEQPNCYGCGGKGWVEIQDQQPEYWPWPAYDIPLDTITQLTKGTITDTNTS